MITFGLYELQIGIDKNFIIFEAAQALTVIRNMVKELPVCEGHEPRELQAAISQVDGIT